MAMMISYLYCEKGQVTADLSMSCSKQAEQWKTTIDFLMNPIIFPASFSCVVHSKSIVVPLSALLDVQRNPVAH